MSALTTKLQNVINAIESNHVQTVEVVYEYEMDEFRYYTAITRKGTTQHRYMVRVWNEFNGDTNEMERFGKCQCMAAAQNLMCRHLIKAAEVDAKRTGQKIYAENIAKYRAYQHFGKKAA